MAALAALLKDQSRDEAGRFASTGSTKVKADPFGTGEGAHVVVHFNNGTSHRIQRLNSGESQGVPGWHSMDTSSQHTFLGDNVASAISALEERGAGHAKGDLSLLLRKRASLGALLKYNADQPRDQQGRFGSGGNGRVHPESIPRAEPGALSARGVAVEGRFARQLAQSIPAAEAAYAKLKDTAGGKILNTDTVRELSADYRNDRATLSPAVHEPASHFTKLMYERRMAEAPTSNSVLFTAGGAGSGKSSGIKNVPAMQRVQDAADVVYDTNMNKFGSAKQKIDQALASGRDVQIAYVARDPVESLTHGALPRAMGSGGGRTVPLAEHIATHVGAAKTIQDLAAHYAGDSRVQIHYIDNTHGRNGAVMSDASLPTRLNFDNLHERLSSALKEEHDAGRISTPVFEGTRGHGSH